MAKEELPRGQLSTIILSTLLDNDKYGYEIIELIREKTNGDVNIKQPSLYSSLKRMQDQGLISSYWRDSEIGGRRHYYSITDYGKKYAEKWQADWTSENIKNTNKTKTVEETEKHEDNKPKGFVQYDLFSNPTLISEPSDEVFDSIKKLRQEADNEQIPESADNMINSLRNTGVTNNTTDSPAPIDLSKEFSQLKKNQKSFSESIKSNETQIFENNSFYVHNEANDYYENQKSNNDNIQLDLNEQNNVYKEENNIFEQNNESNDNVEVPVDEKPTIFQDTKQFIETYDENENSDSLSTEFIDLNNISFSSLNAAEPQEPTNEEFEENFEDNNNNIDVINNEKDYSPILEENEEQPIKDNQPSFETKDDAIYITERLNFETLPKVKKIEPNRFEKYAQHNSSFDKKLTQLYENRYNNSYETENKTPVDYAEEIKETYDNNASEQEVEYENKANYTSNVQEFDNVRKNYNSLTDLQRYYNSQKIKFGIYDKQNKTLDQSNYVKINKLNLLSFSCISIIAILESLIMFLANMTLQQSWNWLYIIVPIAFIGFTVFFVIKYLKEKNKLTPKYGVQNNNWMYNIIFFIVASLILFSLNILFGMDLSQVGKYATTLWYLILMASNYALLPLANYVLIKLKLI